MANRVRVALSQAPPETVQATIVNPAALSADSPPAVGAPTWPQSGSGSRRVHTRDESIHDRPGADDRGRGRGGAPTDAG